MAYRFELKDPCLLSNGKIEITVVPLSPSDIFKTFPIDNGTSIVKSATARFTDTALLIEDSFDLLDPNHMKCGNIVFSNIVGTPAFELDASKGTFGFQTDPSIASGVP